MSPKPKQIGAWIRHLAADNKGLLIGAAVIGVVGLFFLLVVIVPAYKSPKSRMYSSSFGHGAMKRKVGLAFDVKAAQVKRETIHIPYLGEGIISGEPIRVPIIPLAVIKQVHVKEGDYVKKGDLLMELDNRKARRNVEAAELALASVQAEFRRVEAGSSYVLAQERPVADKIEFEAAKKENAVLKEKMSALQSLLNKGVLAKISLSETECLVLDSDRRVREAQFNQEMSKRGVVESKLIASNAVKDAAQNLNFRKSELEDYNIYAPRDGVITAVLVREGEFNQDIGKPAFLLTSGLWFEAYFDQAILGRIEKGVKGKAYLEAFPGHKWSVAAAHVIPQVTFATGGPEINRPLRPRGTGAPEWAATFSVRFAFEDNDPRLSLGMTGNIRAEIEADSIIVHRNALLSIAAGRAVVLQPGDEANTWRRVPVETGYIGHDWAEIKSGVKEGDLVFIDGHRILREGDKVSIEEVDW